MNRTPPTAFGRFDTPRNAAIVAAVMIMLAGLAVLLFGAEGASAVMDVIGGFIWMGLAAMAVLVIGWMLGALLGGLRPR